MSQCWYRIGVNGTPSHVRAGLVPALVHDSCRVGRHADGARDYPDPVRGAKVAWWARCASCSPVVRPHQRARGSNAKQRGRCVFSREGPAGVAAQQAVERGSMNVAETSQAVETGARGVDVRSRNDQLQTGGVSSSSQADTCGCLGWEHDSDRPTRPRAAPALFAERALGGSAVDDHLRLNDDLHCGRSSMPSWCSSTLDAWAVPGCCRTSVCCLATTALARRASSAPSPSRSAHRFSRARRFALVGWSAVLPSVGATSPRRGRRLSSMLRILAPTRGSVVEEVQT
jgi:hypothetical protein